MRIRNANSPPTKHTVMTKLSPAVLIPRPETEHIVETAMELAKSKLVERRASPPACPERSRRVRIVDVGTGSGAIALALAKELPTAEIHATDISPEALEVKGQRRPP